MAMGMICSLIWLRVVVVVGLLVFKCIVDHTPNTRQGATTHSIFIDFNDRVCERFDHFSDYLLP